MYDTDAGQLERIMRRGLQAQTASLLPHTDLAEGAREGARQRRRTRLRMGAAAAALVAVLVAISATDGQSDPSTDNRVEAGPDRPSIPAESLGNRLPFDVASTIPDGWRVESYRGVQIRVPPTWGWGASPLRLDERSRAAGYVCGRAAQAYPRTDWETSLGSHPERAYVGRPVRLGDHCVGGNEETGSHVWFDSPLPAGSEDLGDGLRRVTVDAGEIRVSVAHTDSEELGLILASLTTGSVDGNGCAAESHLFYAEQPGPADVLDLAAAAGSGDFGGMAVCLYEVEVSSQGLIYELLYSTAVDGAAERLFLQRLAEPSAQTPACDIRVAQTVVLQPRIAASTPKLRVRPTSCDFGYSSTGRQLPLEHVAPWAVDGIATYVSGAD